MAHVRDLLVLLPLALALGCPPEPVGEDPPDAGAPVEDAGVDPGAPDAGVPGRDAGLDGGLVDDGGPGPDDAGPGDAGLGDGGLGDGGPGDGGPGEADAGFDAGSPTGVSDLTTTADIRALVADPSCIDELILAFTDPGAFGAQVTGSAPELADTWNPLVTTSFPNWTAPLGSQVAQTWSALQLTGELDFDLGSHGYSALVTPFGSEAITPVQGTFNLDGAEILAHDLDLPWTALAFEVTEQSAATVAVGFASVEFMVQQVLIGVPVTRYNTDLRASDADPAFPNCDGAAFSLAEFVRSNGGDPGTLEADYPAACSAALAAQTACRDALTVFDAPSTFAAASTQSGTWTIDVAGQSTTASFVAVPR